jgi:hypothetical protein
MSAAQPDSQQTTPSIPLKGGWLMLSRLVWMLVTINSVAVLGLFIPFSADYLKNVSDWRWAALFMTGGYVNNQTYVNYYLILMGIFIVIYLSVGCFLFWRKSHDRVVYFVSLMLVAVSVPGAAALHPSLITDMTRDASPLTTLFTINAVVGSMFFFTSLLIFPDGRFIPRWTRWIAVIVFIYIGSLLLPENVPQRMNNLSPLLVSILPLVFFAIAVFAQIYRYFRVSTLLQRQQTRGLVYGLGTSAALIVIFTQLIPLLIPVVRPPNVPAAALAYEMLVSLIMFTLIVIPLMIMTSILRYRLWDIDFTLKR